MPVGRLTRAELHQHGAGRLEAAPINRLAVSLRLHHGQQGGAQRVVDAGRAHDLVTELAQAEVEDGLVRGGVDVLPVHVQEDVTHRQHGLVVPAVRLVETRQEPAGVDGGLNPSSEVVHVLSRHFNKPGVPAMREAVSGKRGAQAMEEAVCVLAAREGGG